MAKSRNKLKMVNDPVYGLINISNGFIFDLIEHPFFQRLRRITQMGLSYLVFPGAHHTRFHHALGCMFLMQKAIDSLRFKGIKISDEEAEALLITILLHDIGHGPFSHAMEHSIVTGISHEEISLRFMEQLNEEFNGKLSLAIKIFKKEYHRPFFNQLVSSQLDIDRLDYLKRDSFYSGVAEGQIHSERIISMLNVKENKLVVEEKGIYSIEKFLVARRLMYWVVYLHKTSVCAEMLLIRTLQRAKELIQQGIDLPMSSALKFFISKEISKENFQKEELFIFSKLDDYDLISSMKEWSEHSDFTLRKLSQMLLNRDLLRIISKEKPMEDTEKDAFVSKTATYFNISHKEASYFVFSTEVANTAYNKNYQKIKVLDKDGNVYDVTEAENKQNLLALSEKVTKYFWCFPKELSE